MKPSDNPILAYLQQHPWKWIHIDTISKDTGLSRRQIREICNTPIVRRNLNISRDEYRFIGNTTSKKYRIVKILKDNYPRWMSAAELTKIANLSRSASYIICGNTDVLPIECEHDYKQHHTSNMVYRYVPNDKRSLVDYVPSLPKQVIESRRVRSGILNTLRKYQGKWLSTSELADIIGGTTSRSVGRYASDLFSEHQQITRKHTYDRWGAFAYSYNPGESPA